ncbi:MAG: NifB/NifX family molybdenum-iron cluster-binding protein [Candidatus Celaenobacter polaris]|nr:NifB/NifX family molybdenum-iron cluster-binding protein [Candidatus Celaenobacter polaris]
MERHFGDAKFYDIYELDNNQILFIKRIPNTVDEIEEVHADPRKARGISSHLLNEKVNVVVSKIFGPNIKRIQKKFVCVVVKDDEITSAIQIISTNKQRIVNEWEKGEERNHLIC